MKGNEMDYTMQLENETTMGEVKDKLKAFELLYGEAEIQLIGTFWAIEHNSILPIFGKFTVIHISNKMFEIDTDEDIWNHVYLPFFSPIKNKLLPGEKQEIKFSTKL